MVWNTIPNTSSGAGFSGLILMAMGDQKGREYLAKLAGQQIATIAGSSRQALDLVIQGEYSLGLQVYNTDVTASKLRGAPIN